MAARAPCAATARQAPESRGAAQPRGRATQTVEDGRDGQRRGRRVEGGGEQANSSAPNQAPAADPGRRRRCRCPSPTRHPPSGGKERSRRRRTRCSTHRAAKRKIDERELMDGARLLEDKCREFSVEGDGRADPSRARRDDLRIQAGRGREVQQDHRSGRRSVLWRCRPSRS